MPALTHWSFFLKPCMLGILAFILENNEKLFFICLAGSPKFVTVQEMDKSNIKLLT